MDLDGVNERPAPDGDSTETPEARAEAASPDDAFAFRAKLYEIIDNAVNAGEFLVAAFWMADGKPQFEIHHVNLPHAAHQPIKAAIATHLNRALVQARREELRHGDE